MLSCSSWQEFTKAILLFGRPLWSFGENNYYGLSRSHWKAIPFPSGWWHFQIFPYNRLFYRQSPRWHRLDVKIKQSKTLGDVISIARLVDEQNQLQRQPVDSSRVSLVLTAPKVNSNPSSRILGLPPAPWGNPALPASVNRWPGGSRTTWKRPMLLLRREVCAWTSIVHDPRLTTGRSHNTLRSSNLSMPFLN